MPAVPKAQRNSVDQHGLKRLAKSEAKTPSGMMRLGNKILKRDLPQLEVNKTKSCRSAGQRCVDFDPNAYRTRFPFHRVESPHDTPNRRLPGWTDCRFILPKVVLEGLRALSIELAHQQQNSDWPAERCRYPRTKNFHLTAALNDYLAKMGYQQFCVPEQKTTGRVRRFIGTST
jgi:hypothetical protein